MSAVGESLPTLITSFSGKIFETSTVANVLPSDDGASIAVLIGLFVYEEKYSLTSSLTSRGSSLIILLRYFSICSICLP